MWLLDANVDIHVLAFLKQSGIEADTTKHRNWQALSNGHLLTVAKEAGFQCIVTQDRLFAQSAAKALKRFPDFSIVVVHLPQKPWKQYVELFKDAWLKAPIQPQPGRIIDWP